MISNEKLGEALGRLALLRRFPSNAHALLALAEILKETCPHDEDLAALVQEVLRGQDEWPGPAFIRKAYTCLIERRKAEQEERLRSERIQENRRIRDQHEAGCPGFELSIDAKDETVSVSRCNAHWGDYCDGVRCRKGDELESKDPGFFKRRLAEELAARPGWISLDEYWNRRFRREPIQPEGASQ